MGNSFPTLGSLVRAADTYAKRVKSLAKARRVKRSKGKK